MRRFAWLVVWMVACPNPDDVEPTDVSDEPTDDVDPLARACADIDEKLGVPRPAGWSAESHCEAAPPDVGAVFRDDVPTMTIRMTAEEYAAMQADFDELTGGGFGDTGAWGGDPCAALAPGDPCAMDFGGGEEPGMCFQVPDGPVTCVLDSWRPPEDAIDACADLAPGDACAFSGGDGQCVPDPFFGMACVVMEPWDTGTGGDTGVPPGPPGSSDPCDAAAEGDACAAGAEAGVCHAVPAGPLTCEIPTFSPADVSAVPIEAAAPFWAREPAWFRAEVAYRGQTWTEVGVRYKGNNGLASAQGEKKPFRLQFDRWEDESPATDNQRFWGFQHLSFSPNATDASNLHQVLAAEVFRARGVPSPESAFVQVELDTGDGPRLLGLYAMTEIPDAPFLERAFGNVDGNLYKPDGRGAHFVSFVQGSWHRENNEGASFTDALAFVAALNADRTDREGWRDALRTTFDIDGFAELYAVNQGIGNWDTYGGLAHNFFLYADPSTDALRFIPWDLDLSFEASGSPDLGLWSFDGSWPLLQAIARDAELNARYHDALRAFYDEELANGRLAERVDTWAARIAPAVAAEDALRPGFAASTETGQAALREHLGAQERAIAEHLGLR